MDSRDHESLSFFPKGVKQNHACFSFTAACWSYFDIMNGKTITWIGLRIFWTELDQTCSGAGFLKHFNKKS